MELTGFATALPESSSPAESGSPQRGLLRRCVTWRGVRNFAGNLLLASIYLAVALPSSHYDWGSWLANMVWLAGAIMVGLMVLFRRSPTVVNTDAASLFSNLGAFVLPVLMRPSAPITGALAGVAIAVEFLGVLLSQGARVVMGRSFGVLPANRGIVSSGPFRIVRHPVYLGWLILGFGFALYYPSRINVAVMVGTIPFVIWRIQLEEKLLMNDSSYRAYSERVRTRLLPFVY